MLYQLSYARADSLLVLYYSFAFLLACSLTDTESKSGLGTVNRAGRRPDRQTQRQLDPSETPVLRQMRRGG